MSEVYKERRLKLMKSLLTHRKGPMMHTAAFNANPLQPLGDLKRRVGRRKYNWTQQVIQQLWLTITDHPAHAHHGIQMDLTNQEHIHVIYEAVN